MAKKKKKPPVAYPTKIVAVLLTNVKKRHDVYAVAKNGRRTLLPHYAFDFGSKESAEEYIKKFLPMKYRDGVYRGTVAEIEVQPPKKRKRAKRIRSGVGARTLLEGQTTFPWLGG